LRLRRARNDANLTQTEIAEQLGWSPSKVLRLENGQTPYQVSDVVALLTLFPQLSSERDELTELARDARKPTLSSRYIDVLTPQFAEWLEHEAYASGIRQYENQIVPGVLQTSDYATGIVNGLLGSVPDQERASRIVDARIERAEPLLGPDGPKMAFVIDESALRRAVGNERGDRGYSSMIDQLQALKRYNTVGRRANGEAIEEDLNPNIAIQIVPSIMGAYAALRGPFELIDFPGGDADPMVYFENPDGDDVVRDQFEHIARYLDLFAELSAAVPAVSETNAYIDAIIAQMESAPDGIAIRPASPKRSRRTAVTA
jgi:transcriptional regulator with XRE-family HTH domain